jgi:apolipoprotein D and lipocalin family protein
MNPRPLKPRLLNALVFPVCLSMLGACSTAARPPVPLAPHVDLSRFMGSWYVIANIPTFLERGAHNAVESYQLDADGSIATTFTFRDGGFDGPQKTYHPRGFVDTSVPGNAVWGMRFVWPIKADYRISFVSDDYGQTIIARESRDYVWIMARTPQIPEADYQRLVQFVAAQGYDISKLQKVPQRW